MTAHDTDNGFGRLAGVSWTELEGLANAVAAPERHTLLACLDRLLDRHVGHKLFTALQYRHAEGWPSGFIAVDPTPIPLPAPSRSVAPRR